MSNEFVILDSVVASLTISDLKFVNDKPNSGITVLGQKLASLCQPPSHDEIFFKGKTFLPYYDEYGTGCFWAKSDDGGGSGQIVIHPVDLPEVRIRIGIKYAVSKDRSASWLTVEHNPTTMVVGSNIHPAIFTNPHTGEEALWPSSDWGANKCLLRLGFQFVDEVGGGVLDQNAKTALECGDVHLVRVQWAGVKRVKSKSQFLQLMTVVCGQTIAREDGIISIANHLGYEFQPFINPETHLLDGLLFKKAYSKKPLFSVSLYDKAIRLNQMHQPVDDLTPEQEITVNGSIRLDMTAHSEGIILLAKKAQKKLQLWSSSEMNEIDFIAPDVYMEGEPQSTLWWLERAIFILSHFNRGTWKRFSFGVWIVPYIQDEILHFDVIARINSKGFHRLLDSPDPVAAAWRSDKGDSSENWAERLAKAAGVSVATAYARRDLWWKDFGIDIKYPVQFYSDVLHFGQASVAKPEIITKMLQAVNTKDGEALVRLYQEAHDDFQRKRVTVLNPALSSRPRAMPLEGPREPEREGNAEGSLSDDADAMFDLPDLTEGEPQPKTGSKLKPPKSSTVPIIFKPLKG
jgi:hypothetical protein